MFSSVPVNRLQAGNLGIQDIFNNPTNLHSSTHFQSVPQLVSVTVLFNISSTPGPMDSVCIWQLCFRHGCVNGLE